jgi:hypothetical protein
MGNKPTKCTCERPDDYVCDYCDEQESKRILKEAKERHSNKENPEDDFIPNFPPNKSFEYIMVPREEMEFIKRCIKVYWEYHSNRVHPDNQKDWVISQNILKNDE